MKKLTKYFLILAMALINISSLFAEEDLPAKWSYGIEYREDGKVDLIFTATMEDTWHIYTQKEDMAPPGGYTEFVFELDSSSTVNLIGRPSEPEGHTHFEEAYKYDIKEFEGTAEFRQTVEVKALEGKESVAGKIYWIVCQSGGVCKMPMSPTEFDFEIDTEKIQREEESFVWIFIAGFLGGFAALLTPCVFPMIPMTVSFFTKQSENKAKGISNALIYGFSIIAIYVALGLGVTAIFGAGALNELSTSTGFNLFFFVILIVFAASFLGAFEIQMPNSWVNKADSKADKGGLIGIFFMAFTLALVSFSCTGPVIGTLLVEAATTGMMGPFFGMLGFSLALALPFTLFAIFPGWLNSLPQSGGWLNSVKVVLGLLEIALAMKFLSNADLVEQWGIITREVFIATWIVVFALIGFYLLGKIKMPHDSDLPYVSVPRMFMAIIVFTFVVYMIPGMFGAPLKIIAGFPPPDFYSEGWNAGAVGFGGGTASAGHEADHGDAGHCPNNLPCFHDYEEGMAYAKEVGKPVLLDFTGWACVNCRKMEGEVWIDPKVTKYLAEDYVLISLYVDEKTELPEDQKYTNKDGVEIEQVGQKWLDFEMTHYGEATQPLYVLIDHEENMLIQEKRSYDPDIQVYLDFLQSGVDEYNKRFNKQ